jgi:hypothetical protein
MRGPWASSVTTEEDAVAPHQGGRERHAEGEQHQRDDAGRPDVEPLEAQVVDELGKVSVDLAGYPGSTCWPDPPICPLAT